MTGVRPILVYLAGPQDGISPDEARGWREAMVDYAPSGMVFFSPAHAFLGTGKVNFAAVERANRYMIAHAAHGVLAFLGGEGRAFGTIREIEFATMMSKPVAVVGKVDSLMQTDIGVYDTFETACAFLLEAIQEDRNPPDILQMLGLRGQG